jgi:hypothetical protein
MKKKKKTEFTLWQLRRGRKSGFYGSKEMHGQPEIYKVI